MYKLKYKIWLEQNGKVFGQGPYNLLEGIKRTGSLSRAAKEQNMSYSQAHSMMKRLSEQLGFPLLNSKSGGTGGGRTEITPGAEELLKSYGAFYRDCEKAVEDLFYEHFVANNAYLQNDDLLAALDIGAQGIISLVGGGGKTTLMWYLAHRLAETGKRVLVTTTTHIMPPTDETNHLVISDKIEKVRSTIHKKLKPGQICTVGTGYDGPKLAGVPLGWIDQLANDVDFIIVEADGSKQRPFKAPGEHEPVIPTESNIVITVIGIDALSKPLDDENVHRPELISEVSGTLIGEPITIETIANTIVSEQGGRKDIPKHARWAICINKVDTLALKQDVDMLAKYILAKQPFVPVIATSREASNMVVEIWRNY